MKNQTNTINTDTDFKIFEELKQLIDNHQKFLVVSHVDPDGDSIGSLMAVTTYLKDCGKDVFPVIADPIPGKYHFLKGILDVKNNHDYEKLEIDIVIILECPNYNRIGGPVEFVSQHKKVINLDHHADNQVTGLLNWVDSSKSSVGEMIYEYLEYVGYDINTQIAEYLYTAILTDTGRFRFSSTSSRTMEIGGKLIANGANPRIINEHIYFEMNSASLRLTGKVLNNIEFLLDEQLCILVMTNKMTDESKAHKSDAEGLVDYTLYGKTVKVGAFIKEQNGQLTKVSLRSKSEIDVAQIAAKFGGGGHKNAAGCTLNMSVEKARLQIIEIFKEVLHG